MASLLAAEVWHYWISVAIFGATVVILAALGVGYLLKITANRYPKQR